MAKKGAVRPAGMSKEPRKVGATEKGRVQEFTRGVSTETNAGRVNKEEVVRLAIGNHPRANAERFACLLKGQGIDASAGLVRLIQSEMRGGGQAGAKQAPGRPKGEKGAKGSRTTSRRTRRDEL